MNLPVADQFTADAVECGGVSETDALIRSRMLPQALPDSSQFMEGWLA